MYEARAHGESYTNDVFITGVNNFIETAMSKGYLASNNTMRCPCTKCKNRRFINIRMMEEHLYTVSHQSTSIGPYTVKILRKSSTSILAQQYLARAPLTQILILKMKFGVMMPSQIWFLILPTLMKFLSHLTLVNSK
ncbi:unnamed protein product [Rhodiola kirilowii]